MSSSMSPTKNCRHFSLYEIKVATNSFHETKVLGQGGEGTVYLANLYISPEYDRVAVKVLKETYSNDMFEKEIETMANIQHPHLVSLLGYCDESGKKILVYEYMKNGNLYQHVNEESNSSLSWQKRFKICLDAARGLQYFHTETQERPKGIVHRDVKPANILLDEKWVAKVSDFGMLTLSHAGQVDSSMDTNLNKGTPGYYAPEYLLGITTKVDVYAFGVVLFQVLCLKSPWETRLDDQGNSYYREEGEDLGVWARENVDTRIKGKISEKSLKAFTDIIGSSLRKDPEKRPSMKYVVQDLEKVLEWLEHEDEAKKLQPAIKWSGSSSKPESKEEQNFLKESDLEYLQQLAGEKIGGSAMNWTEMMNKSIRNMSFRAWYSHSEAETNGPSWYRFLTVYEDVTPEVVRDFFLDDDYRRDNWDKSLSKAKTLIEESPITKTMVVKWVRKIPICGRRKYIIGRRIWKSDHTYYCVTKGMPNHPSAPRRGKLKCVDPYYSSWRIRAVKSSNGKLTSCEVLFFHSEDIGLPIDVERNGVQRAMWKSATDTYYGLLKYMKSLQSR